MTSLSILFLLVLCTGSASSDSDKVQSDTNKSTEIHSRKTRARTLLDLLTEPNALHSQDSDETIFNANQQVPVVLTRNASPRARLSSIDNSKLAARQSRILRRIDVNRAPFKFPADQKREKTSRLRCQFMNGTLWSTATQCDDDLGSDACENIFGQERQINLRPVLCDSIEMTDLAKRCAKSCKICCETPMFDCEDEAASTINCREHISKCRDPLWSRFMMDACAHTCGVCDEDKCFDLVKDCNTFEPLCNHSTVGGSLKQLCPLTCGSCSPNEPDSSQEQTQDNSNSNANAASVSVRKTPKEVIVIVRQPASGSSNCEDIAKSCVQTKKFCKDKRYEALMKQKCAKTCGYCTDEKLPTVSTIRRILNDAAKSVKDDGSNLSNDKKRTGKKPRNATNANPRIDSDVNGERKANVVPVNGQKTALRGSPTNLRRRVPIRQIIVIQNRRNRVQAVPQRDLKGLDFDKNADDEDVDDTDGSIQIETEIESDENDQDLPNIGQAPARPLRINRVAARRALNLRRGQGRRVVTRVPAVSVNEKFSGAQEPISAATINQRRNGRRLQRGRNTRERKLPFRLRLQDSDEESREVDKELLDLLENGNSNKDLAKEDDIIEAIKNRDSEQVIGTTETIFEVITTTTSLPILKSENDAKKVSNSKPTENKGDVRPSEGLVSILPLRLAKGRNASTNADDLFKISEPKSGSRNEDGKLKEVSDDIEDSTTEDPKSMSNNSDAKVSDNDESGENDKNISNENIQNEKANSSDKKEPSVKVVDDDSSGITIELSEEKLGDLNTINIESVESKEEAKDKKLEMNDEDVPEKSEELDQDKGVENEDFQKSVQRADIDDEDNDFNDDEEIDDSKSRKKRSTIDEEDAANSSRRRFQIDPPKILVEENGSPENFEVVDFEGDGRKSNAKSENSSSQDFRLSQNDKPPPDKQPNPHRNSLVVIGGYDEEKIESKLKEIYQGIYDGSRTPQKGQSNVTSNNASDESGNDTNSSESNNIQKAPESFESETNIYQHDDAEKLFKNGPEQRSLTSKESLPVLISNNSSWNSSMNDAISKSDNDGIKTSSLNDESAEVTEIKFENNDADNSAENNTNFQSSFLINNEDLPTVNNDDSSWNISAEDELEGNGIESSSDEGDSDKENLDVQNNSETDIWSDFEEVFELLDGDGDDTLEFDHTNEQIGDNEIILNTSSLSQKNIQENEERNTSEEDTKFASGQNVNEGLTTNPDLQFILGIDSGLELKEKATSAHEIDSSNIDFEENNQNQTFKNLVFKNPQKIFDFENTLTKSPSDTFFASEPKPDLNEEEEQDDDDNDNDDREDEDDNNSIVDSPDDFEDQAAPDEKSDRSNSFEIVSANSVEITDNPQKSGEFAAANTKPKFVKINGKNRTLRGEEPIKRKVIRLKIKRKSKKKRRDSDKNSKGRNRASLGTRSLTRAPISKKAQDDLLPFDGVLRDRNGIRIPRNGLDITDAIDKIRKRYNVPKSAETTTTQVVTNATLPGNGALLNQTQISMELLTIFEELKALRSDFENKTKDIEVLKSLKDGEVFRKVKPDSESSEITQKETREMEERRRRLVRFIEVEEERRRRRELQKRSEMERWIRTFAELSDSEKPRILNENNDFKKARETETSTGVRLVAGPGGGVIPLPNGFRLVPIQTIGTTAGVQQRGDVPAQVLVTGQGRRPVVIVGQQQQHDLQQGTAQQLQHFFPQLLPEQPQQQLNGQPQQTITAQPAQQQLSQEQQQQQFNPFFQGPGQFQVPLGPQQNQFSGTQQFPNTGNSPMVTGTRPIAFQQLPARFIPPSQQQQQLIRQRLSQQQPLLQPRVTRGSFTVANSPSRFNSFGNNGGFGIPPEKCRDYYP